MKKEFLDYLYELRSRVQQEVERLVEVNKSPKSQCCENMSNYDDIDGELKTRRSQLSSLDETIETYLKLH